jgi:hypothetical protein
MERDTSTTNAGSLRFEVYPDPRAAQFLKMYPPVPCIENLPEWLSRLPVVRHDPIARAIEGIDSNVRRCPGVVDYVRLGYLFFMPYDLILRQESDGSWRWNMQHGGNTSLDEWAPTNHDPRQVEGMEFDPETHFPSIVKLRFPCFINTPPGVSTAILDSFFHRNRDFEVIPGVFESDIVGDNLRIFIRMRRTDEPVYIAAGTPLAQMLPFRREPAELVVYDETNTPKELSDKTKVYRADRSRFSFNYMTTHWTNDISRSYR